MERRELPQAAPGINWPVTIGASLVAWAIIFGLIWIIKEVL